jgi:hypothetical protein
MRNAKKNGSQYICIDKNYEFKYIFIIGDYMKRLIIPIFLLLTLFNGCLGIPSSVDSNNQKSTENTFLFGQFTIPPNAELLESTEFKDNGITYMIEQRYKLTSGQILYAYYDVEGNNSITHQRIEDAPLLALGNDINISGMPGYREFFFGTDRRQLVQFIKLMRLGWQRDYRGGVKTPSLGDYVFTPSSGWRSEWALLLDLYDETWVLEHRRMEGRRVYSIDTTTFYHVKEYRD